MAAFEVELLPNENIRYRTNPHWMIFLMPLGIIAMAFFLVYLNPLLTLMAYLLAAAGVLSLLLSAITYKYTEYVVTNMRFIKKYGFIARRSNGVPVNQIESVDTEQNIAGRMLGFGSVIVKGTGGTQEIAFNIPHPFEFRTQLQQSINE